MAIIPGRPWKGKQMILNRYRTQKHIAGHTYDYEIIVYLDVNGRRRKTTRSLGRAGVKASQGIIRPANFNPKLPGEMRGQFGPSETPFSDHPGNCEDFPQESLSEALSVGAVVRHRLNPELIGRITSLDTTKATIELLTWPTPWWRRWGKRPVPVLVENLELV